MMDEFKALTIEKLDKREYEAAMRAINEVRRQRANEVAKAKAIQIIVDAVNEALMLAHPADLIDTLDELYMDVADAAEDEERAMRGE